MRPTLFLTLAASALFAIACSGSPTATAPEAPADTAEAPAETAETAAAPAAETAEAASDAKAAAKSAETVSYFAEDGIAIAGADPVAYFTAGDYVPGTSDFTHEWNGVTWQFASAENRDTFAADPENYAPQYGGYCAWAVSEGYTAPVDPTAWKIVDGKLYLNYDAKIQARWEKDIPGNIAEANANWPAVLKQLEHPGISVTPLPLAHPGPQLPISPTPRKHGKFTQRGTRNPGGCQGNTNWAAALKKRRCSPAVTKMAVKRLEKASMNIINIW
jgi:YHS domain-containing protein